MPIRQYLINDPVFAEYVFYVLNNATQEEKNSLNIHQRQIFKTTTSMRRYADNEGLEKKLLLLTQLGVNWQIVLSHNQSLTGDKLTDILKEVPEQWEYATKRADIIKAMKEGKVFVFGGQEIMLTLQMAAQNSHSGIFVLDHKYRKLTDKVARFKYYNEENSADALTDSIKNFDDTRKVMLSAMALLSKAEEIIGINEMELQILMAMMSYRHTFVDRERIYEGLQSTYRVTQIKKTIEIMCKKDLLAKQNIKQKEKMVQKYSVVQKGMDLVFKFMKYSLNQSENL